MFPNAMMSYLPVNILYVFPYLRGPITHHQCVVEIVTGCFKNTAVFFYSSS